MLHCEPECHLNFVVVAIFKIIKRAHINAVLLNTYARCVCVYEREREREDTIIYEGNR